MVRLLLMIALVIQPTWLATARAAPPARAACEAVRPCCEPVVVVTCCGEERAVDPCAERGDRRQAPCRCGFNPAEPAQPEPAPAPGGVEHLARTALLGPAGDGIESTGVGDHAPLPATRPLQPHRPGVRAQSLTCSWRT